MTKKKIGKKKTEEYNFLNTLYSCNNFVILKLSHFNENFVRKLSSIYQ